MDAIIQQVFDIVFHLDRHLNEWAGYFGPWLYLVLFAVIFCETGLVVTPFLPGDSLLFAVGALAARADSPLDLPAIAVILSVAAVAGDAANYSIGLRLGPKVFSREDSWLLNKKHLVRTQRFYEKHGGKTIFLARFVPFIRTFAPFVAGIGRMRYPRFAMFNVTGGVSWVLACVLGGYFFGNVQIVKENFSIVVVVIVLISLVPVAVEFLRARREAKTAKARPEDTPA
jgi:membrane-associated protein